MELVTKTEVATVNTPRPIEFKHWRYDRKDLESIKLDPSRRIIRVVADTYVPKDVEWDTRLSNGFKRYTQLATGNATNHPDLKIKEDGYHIKIDNLNNLDLSQISARIMSRRPRRGENGFVEIVIPYLYAQPKPWYRTWPGLWNRAKALWSGPMRYTKRKYEDIFPTFMGIGS